MHCLLQTGHLALQKISCRWAPDLLKPVPHIGTQVDCCTAVMPSSTSAHVAISKDKKTCCAQPQACQVSAWFLRKCRERARVDYTLFSVTNLEAFKSRAAVSGLRFPALRACGRQMSRTKAFQDDSLVARPGYVVAMLGSYHDKAFTTTTRHYPLRQEQSGCRDYTCICAFTISHTDTDIDR